MVRFGEALARAAAEVFPPSLRVFLPFDRLKLQLKALKAAHVHTTGSTVQQLQQQAMIHNHMAAVLTDEIVTLNAFFTELEATAVMRWQALSQHAEQQLSAAAPGPTNGAEGLLDTLQLLINFHGETLLISSWSHLNLTAVSKFLKKYDKQMGSCIKPAMMVQVLRQPFCSTGLVTSLARRVLALVERVGARAQVPLHAPSGAALSSSPDEAQGPSHAGCSSGACEQPMELAAAPHAPPSLATSSAVMSRRIQGALHSWQQLASSATTPSTLAAWRPPQPPPLRLQPQGQQQQLQPAQGQPQQLQLGQQQQQQLQPAQGQGQLQPVRQQQQRQPCSGKEQQQREQQGHGHGHGDGQQQQQAFAVLVLHTRCIAAEEEEDEQGCFGDEAFGDSGGSGSPPPTVTGGGGVTGGGPLCDTVAGAASSSNGRTMSVAAALQPRRPGGWCPETEATSAPQPALLWSL